LHARGGINNGLTKDEIKKVFPQAAIYYGVPAAIDTFGVASEVFQRNGSGRLDQRIYSDLGGRR
jgi:alkylhydroperoxidase/carboxymuconolactone decarboxylase family protein YurZ